MSLMTFLSTSSFFLSDYLTTQIEASNYRAGQFSYALKYKNIAALTLAENESDFGSMNWLTLNQALAKSQKNSALKLGHWYKQQSQQQSDKKALDTAIMWFEQAIRLHSQQAIVTLAQLYFQHDELIKAQTTLRQLPEVLHSNELADASLMLRINIAVTLGEVGEVEMLMTANRFNHYGNSQVQSLLFDLDRYMVINSNAQGSKALQFDKASSCLTSLQLFATNLSHLKHIEQLIKAFKEQQALAEFVCLPTPKYISAKQLDCLSDSQQAIVCDEARWQEVAENVDSRHLGLMLNKGGANVHLGILYFDVEDNANVFSHEVSHLLGFVDEYPMRKDHEKCQGVQSKPFSHNITVLERYYRGDKEQLRESILMKIPWADRIKDDTPILQLIEAKLSNHTYWQLGTPVAYKEQIGVHLSESCLNATLTKDFATRPQTSAYSAFKPLSRHTQLRYFSKKFPKEYLTLLKDKPSAYLMPSFHYNIALALYQQGKVSAARDWLLQAAEWEVNPLIRAKILRGEW